MSAIIQVSNLSKEYRAIKAVNDISFTVNKGDVYGFLGQNGAGKSTTIRMLLTLIAPTAGSVEIFGKNLFTHRREILQQVGAVIEKPDLYKYLTGYENLRLFARMSGLSATQQQLMEQLDRVGLIERAHSKVRTYSQGMKQRLGIAVALIHNPQLIILDEPTNGLDPQGIADIRNLILHLSRHQGKTIVVSSHLLHEIEMIANRMLIIDKGRKIIEGPVQELFDPKRIIVHVQVTNPPQTLAWLNNSHWKEQVREHHDQTIVLQMDKQQIPLLTSELVQAGAGILAIQPQHSLESYFLSLTTENQHVDAFTN
jgi:ABC-type multidrug transport system ATPase subunit